MKFSASRTPAKAGVQLRCSLILGPGWRAGARKGELQ